MSDPYCNCGYGQGGVYLHQRDCPAMTGTPRYAYELPGAGWKDGRLGQAYDAVAAVLKDRGDRLFRHPLLASIEELDDAA